MSHKRQTFRQKLDFIFLVVILIPLGFLAPIVAFLMTLWGGVSALMQWMTHTH